SAASATAIRFASTPLTAPVMSLPLSKSSQSMRSIRRLPRDWRAASIVGENSTPADARKRKPRSSAFAILQDCRRTPSKSSPALLPRDCLHPTRRHGGTEGTENTEKYMGGYLRNCCDHRRIHRCNNNHCYPCVFLFSSVSSVFSVPPCWV